MYCYFIKSTVVIHFIRLKDLQDLLYVIVSITVQNKSSITMPNLSTLTFQVCVKRQFSSRNLVHDEV